MIEVVFDESVAANLRVVTKQHRNREEKTTIAYIDESSKASNCEVNDILCLRLYLDKGPINCNLDNNCRKKYIEEIYYENYSYINNLNRLKKISKLAAEKNEFRIWVDNLPSSLLGLYCVCKDLIKYDVDVYVMDINVCVKGYGKIFSWAQMSTESIFNLLKKNVKLSINQLNECKSNWNKYANTDKLLRSYVNGSIVGIQENFFDNIIMSAFDENIDTTISEIIRTITKDYLACIDDYYIIYRIKCLVNKGQLLIIKEDSNAYLMVIRK